MLAYKISFSGNYRGARLLVVVAAVEGVEGGIVGNGEAECPPEGIHKEGYRAGFSGEARFPGITGEWHQSTCTGHQASIPDFMQ